MAVRGDPARVLALTGTSDFDAASLWLEAAHLVVDSRIVGGGCVLSDVILTAIEEHLAAHYIERGVGKEITSERLPDWSASYAQGDTLADLRSTRNGQIAVQLDTCGILAEMSKPRPQFAVF